MIEKSFDIVSYYARPASFNTGGVNTSRQQWMRAYAELGARITVLDASGGFQEQLVSHANVTWKSIRHFAHTRPLMVPRRMRKMIRAADLVYLHEGWTLSNAYAAATCVRMGIPYIVMPHGVYNSELVKDLRFRAIRSFVEAWVLRHALAVHVFFDSEIKDVHAISPSATTITAVTGLDMPDESWSDSSHEDYIAWLGRYDINHKGIDKLLQALKLLPASHRPQIKMHGPDHRGDRERVEQMVRQLELGSEVIVGDNLSPDDAKRFLVRSKGFVHVPRWEAFGRTIAESLSLGVPVLLSSEAEIARDLRQASAAVIVEGEPERIAAGIVDLERDGPALSIRGRSWAAKHLSWPATSSRALQQIKDLLT